MLNSLDFVILHFDIPDSEITKVNIAKWGQVKLGSDGSYGLVWGLKKGWVMSGKFYYAYLMDKL